MAQSRRSQGEAAPSVATGMRRVYHAGIDGSTIRSPWRCRCFQQGDNSSVIDAEVQKIALSSRNRVELWTALLEHVNASSIAEIGVFRGNFAAKLLRRHPAIKRYYMVDPWRHLEDWNKPANKEDDAFEAIYREALAKTEFASDRRVVLRGKTTDVIGRIPDGTIDFAYVDGDHTLRGISIDLISVYPKVRLGGWLGGDDLSPSIWQHSNEFEPSFVFPFAVHFAEAVGVPIYALPHRQFLIEKIEGSTFKLVDLVGIYADTSLRGQLLQGPPGTGTPRRRRIRARRQGPTDR
jgi:Methyltransferase domain